MNLNNVQISAYQNNNKLISSLLHYDSVATAEIIATWNSLSARRALDKYVDSAGCLALAKMHVN